MLPLWIIDLTQPSQRRDIFAGLIRGMSHVGVHAGAAPAENDNIAIQRDYDGIVSAGDGHRTVVSDFVEINPEERAEERRAERRSNISGNYWLYSQMPFMPPESDDPVDGARAVYAFQERIVREGGRFIRMLRQSDAEPFRTVSVVIIGDITEQSSRALFASLALLLQKEKGRILPHHVHQGMEITGMLFIPCDVNSHDVGSRKAYKRLLHEIEISRDNPVTRGYDRMILYQDVQNRTQCSYPLLDSKKTAEYLFQCIVHIYYACNAVHPLISGTASADSFYMSMGATSVFFDMALEDERDRRKIASDILETFRSVRKGEKKIDQSQKLSAGEFLDIKGMLKSINDLEPIDIESIKLPDPDPDPLKDMASPTLKKRYYHKYLRYLPVNFMREVYSRIDDSTRVALQGMAAARRRATANTCKTLRANLRRLIREVTPDSGALIHIEEELAALQQNISVQRGSVRRQLEVQFWDYISDNFIPSKARQSFDDYHSAYVADIDNSSGESGGACTTLKEETLKDLAAHLGRQSTGMAIAARCIVGGIIFALGIVPVLSWLSSDGIVDLGRVRRFAAYWYVAMFFVPSLAEIVRIWWRRRRTNSLLSRLKAYFVHDAYARVASRIENETQHFYDSVSGLCGRYLDRIKRIRQRSACIDPNPGEYRRELPSTAFSLDLIGAIPQGLIPPDWVEYSRIRVAGNPVAVRNLAENNYFTLINGFSDQFMTLFDDIGDEDERLMRRQGEGELPADRFLSAEELESMENDRWSSAFSRFSSALLDAVGKEMLPRECPTVGDNIRRYFRETRSADFLRRAVDYAAANGEITSSADAEFSDVKAGRMLTDIFDSLLPHSNSAFQTDGYDSLLRRYLFITRWRSYDAFSLNRIFPREDFDDEIRRRRVVSDTDIDKDAQRFPLSSVVIAALFPDDEAVAGWFRLFSPEDYGEAQRLRLEYRNILNTND